MAFSKILQFEHMTNVGNYFYCDQIILSYFV